MLVADVDLIADQIGVRMLNFLGSRMAQPLNDNLTFLENMVEQLNGSDALIGLRSRGTKAKLARAVGRNLRLENGSVALNQLLEVLYALLALEQEALEEHRLELFTGGLELRALSQECLQGLARVLAADLV